MVVTSWSLDTFGRKPTMMALVAIYSVGGILVTASQNIGMFIAARAIHGLASVGLIPASTSSWPLKSDMMVFSNANN